MGKVIRSFFNGCSGVVGRILNLIPVSPKVASGDETGWESEDSTDVSASLSVIKKINVTF